MRTTLNIDNFSMEKLHESTHEKSKKKQGYHYCYQRLSKKETDQ